MTDEAKACLLALAHLGVVQSKLAHPGYAELHKLKLISHYAPRSPARRSWYLTQAGRHKARKLFGLTIYHW